MLGSLFRPQEPLARGLHYVYGYVFAVMLLAIALFRGFDFHRGPIRLTVDVRVAVLALAVGSYFLTPCLVNGDCVYTAFGINTAAILATLGVLLHSTAPVTPPSPLP